MEDLRRLKEKCGMTHQEIADASGIPVGTVHRVLSGRAKDPSYYTVSAMRDAMSADLPDDEPQPASVPEDVPSIAPAGSPADDPTAQTVAPVCHSCPRDMPTGRDFQRLSDNFMELNHRAEESFDKERAGFDKERAAYKQQIHRLSCWLMSVSIFLAIIMLCMLALCVYDILNPTRGWVISAHLREVLAGFFV